MKRPRIFYLVAAWWCLAMFLLVGRLNQPSRAYQAAGEPVPMLWTFVPLFALGFSVWQIVGLIRLRRFHRWFAVVFFCWRSLTLVWVAAIGLRRPTVKFFPLIIVFSVLVALDVLSAWYLSRRAFREFAVQFVAEYESRMMQKAAQKRIQDEIRSRKS